MQLSLNSLLIWADKTNDGASPAVKVAHILVRILVITVKEFRANELSIRSAALTYTVMLSLVPLLAMGTAVVKGLGGGDQLRQAIYEYVETIEPSATPSEDITILEGERNKEESSSLHMHEAIDKLFNYVDRTNFATLGTIGVLGLVLSVILVFGNIELAMNTIWKVENGRSIMRKISDYLAILFLLPFSLNVGIASSTVLRSEALQEKFSILMPILWIQPFILKLLPVFFLALTLYVIYLFFPHTRVKTVPALIGSVFAGFFWFATQNLYLTLQVGVSKYNAIYGSFATLPLFLIWMYIGWIFILAGAQLAFACQNRKTYRLVPHRAEPSLQLAVAFDLIDYILKNFENNTATTVDDFKEDYPSYESGVVETTAGKLLKADLIHYSGDKSDIMPSLPRKQLSNHILIASILGNTFSDTQGGQTSKAVLEYGASEGAISLIEHQEKEE